jgi:hypothetical protein
MICKPPADLLGPLLLSASLTKEGRPPSGLFLAMNERSHRCRRRGPGIGG